MVVELFVAFVALAVALILIGVVLIIISIIVYGRKTEETEVGGVVIIGPIPIVFGSSLRIVKVVLILAIALTVLTIILALITLRMVVT